MSFIIRSKRVENRFYIDNEFIDGYARKVGWPGQVVYLALCRHERSGKAFPSVRHLAGEIGISTGSVSKGIKNLKEYGIIKIERTAKGGYIYWLIDHEVWKKVFNFLNRKK